MVGPLNGYKVIEIAGIGPGPFAAMLLADMGAEVIRVERAGAVRGPLPDSPHFDVLLRGRKNVAIDLKHSDGVEALLTLVESADALIEGFRPGVMERLGVGPDVCLARNQKLVFGRMTGWGQEGPYAQAAGHDINYIALAGALAHFGRAGEAPVPPLNMVGDFGGGGMFLAYGVVRALLEAQRSGQGQVVDTAMVDGTAVLMSMFWSMKVVGLVRRERSRHQPARHRRPLLRRVQVHRRRVHLARLDRTTVLRRVAAAHRTRRRRGVRASDGQGRVAGAEGPSDRGVRAEDVRRVVRADGDDRRVLRAGVDDERSGEHPHNVERQTFIDFAGTMQPAPRHGSAERSARWPTARPRRPAHP